MASISKGGAKGDTPEAGEQRKVERKDRGLIQRSTLSTSTSSFEPLDPHDPQLNRLASVAFSGKVCFGCLPLWVILQCIALPIFIANAK